MRTTFPTGAVNLAEMSFSVDKTNTEKILLDPPLENTDQTDDHLEEQKENPSILKKLFSGRQT